MVHGLLVITLHRFDILIEQVDKLLFPADSVGMSLVLLVDLLGMLLVDGGLGIAELSLLLQLLLL